VQRPKLTQAVRQWQLRIRQCGIKSSEDLIDRQSILRRALLENSLRVTHMPLILMLQQID
jgi:hypothetical protein